MALLAMRLVQTVAVLTLAGAGVHTASHETGARLDAFQCGKPGLSVSYAAGPFSDVEPLATAAVVHLALAGCDADLMAASPVSGVTVYAPCADHPVVLTQQLAPLCEHLGPTSDRLDVVIRGPTAIPELSWLLEQRMP
jgi:hypothetical protein